MSLVRNLMQSSAQGMIDTSDIESSFGEIHEGFLDDACVELMSGILTVNEAYYTADVIGSCRVVTEGADATVVMENIIKSGIAKLVDLWRRFLAKVRAFFAKAIQLVKSMMLTGKKFVDEFGAKIKARAKSTNNFAMKYNGYAYDVAEGMKVAMAYNIIFAKDCEEITGGFDYAATHSTEEIMKRIGVKSTEERVSASDHLNEVIRKCDGQASSISDLTDNIKKAFRGGDDEPGEHVLKVSEIDVMLDTVANAKKFSEMMNRSKKSMEDNCNNVIRKLQSLQKDSKSDVDDKYETASTISSWLSSLLTALKSICSTSVSMFKETAAGYTRVLRKVLNASDKKLVGEGFYAFEGEDALDVELDDMDDVDEAAIAGADDPEGDTDDIGLVKEGCGKKCATAEGCKSDDEDPLAEAMMYL